MTQKVENISRRLVSFLGNSGQTWHVPPRTSLELPDFELSDNAKVQKLKVRGLISVTQSEKGKAPSSKTEQTKDRSKKQKAAG